MQFPNSSHKVINSSGSDKTIFRNAGGNTRMKTYVYMLQAMCGFRHSIECQADQSFYKMSDKNSQAFYRMPEYLLNSYTETILITHEGPLKVHACH